MKNLKKNLKKNMKILRTARKKYLNSDSSEPSLWLTDNFHIIEKNYSAAVRASKEIDFNAVNADITDICLTVCSDGVLPEDEKIIRLLLTENLSTAELRHLPFFITYALISLAAKGLKSSGKLLINAVKSLIRLSDTDFGLILFEVSETEKILCQDPVGVYRSMDEHTKDMYRKAVCREAEKTGKTEATVAVDALEKAKNDGKHIGFFLDIKKSNKKTGIFLQIFEAVIPLIAGIFLAVATEKWYVLILTYLPLWEALKFITNLLISNLSKPESLPKMDYSNGMPDSEKTVIAISTLLPAAGKAKEIVPHIKDICLSNCRDNTCICILADLRSASTPTVSSDRTDIKAMKRVINSLNEQYPGKFVLAVRPRVFSKTENEYTGHERKRGAITALIKFISGNGNDFLTIHGDEKNLLGAKYVMALDSDTQMPIGSLRNLVATASHPLNRPVISIREQRVISGYGIISPRVETSIESACRTHFSSVMAGTGGLPAYSAAAGEKYQDFFGESIFSGKGLIDVEAFGKLLTDRFPEQRILSHDILEGMILRTAFAGETALTDSFPGNENSYFKRLNRWIRGDIQNLPFIFKKNHSVPSGTLPSLGKWWLIDNIRRAVTPIIAVFGIIISLFLPDNAAIAVTAAALLSAVMPDLFSCFITLIKGGISMLSRLYFSSAAPYALTCLMRAFVSAVTLPRSAFCSLDAICRSLFRLIFSKKHLLQWTTAADSENDKNAHSFMKKGLLPALLGAALIIFGSYFLRAMGVLFLLDIPFSYFSSKRRNFRKKTLTESEKNRLISYCASMWRFYEKYCCENDNFLIPDNIQETPVYRVAHRTSPTNIGLMLCAFLAARDFDFISTSELENLLTKSMETILKLEKYEGNLYNWYDTETLEVMQPAFVSTVDSGNFLCCVTALKEGLKEYQNERPGLENIIKQCETIISGCDLAFLFDKRRNLFHIGYDCASGEKTNSYFDLLMSEARMTSYFAAASGSVPVRHWETLGRTLSKDGRYTGPVSWSGTMFEYFMPAIFLPSIRNSLGSEALRFCIHSQKKRVKNMNIPYGISESGFYAFDRELNYQYKAHGVSRLSLKSSPDDETVISPYSSFLTIPEDPHSSMSNLKRLEKLGLYGAFGFFEAADFTKSRTDGQDFSVVRSCMAHHVGMSFLASANAVFGGIMQKRFMNDDAMAGGRSLLYERIPSDAKVYKNIERRDAPKRPERIPKIKAQFEGIALNRPNSQTLTNGEWSVFASDSGMSVSAYRNISVFKRGHDPLTSPDGVFAALKTPDGNILPFTLSPIFKNCEQASAAFTENSVIYKNRDKNFSCSETVTVHPRLPCEIRSFTVRNRTKAKKSVTLMIYCEPMLENMNGRTGHPAFSKLFIGEKYIAAEKILTFTRKNTSNGESLYISAGFSDKSEFEYSTDREAVIPRSSGISGLFKNNFNSSSTSADKCLALQLTINLQPHSAVTESLIFCAASNETEAVNHLVSIRKEGLPQISRCALSPFDPTSITGIYAKKIIERTLFGSPIPKEILSALRSNRGSRDDLWAIGISGDFPIILINAGKESISYVSAFTSLHGKLRLSGLITELVFLSDEPDGYVNALRDEILKSGVSADLINKRGGIFIINTAAIPGLSLEVLRASAVAVYPENEENESQESITEIKQPIPSKKAVETKNGFIKNGYMIGNEPYLPWCHIVCNRNFGTLLSDSSLGYTWALNSRENKLTPWSNDTRTDLHGEKLIMKTENGCFDVIKGGTAFFKSGKGEYFSEADGVTFRTTVTVPGENMCKVISVSIVNNSQREKEFNLSYTLEPIMGDTDKNSMYIKKEISSGVYAHTPYNKTFNGYMFVTSDGESDYRADKEITVTRKIKLPPANESKVKFYLSYAATKNAAAKMPYIPPKNVNRSRIEIHTPDKELNALFNDFLPDQIIGGRIFGRTGFYQCSGAHGFRDQLQDAMAVSLTHPEILRVQIFRCAAAQFTDGDVLHWFHELFIGNKRILRGVRTLYSDDLLWLPLAVSEYCIKTGDTSILGASVPYIEAPTLESGERERYGEYTLSDKKDSLYRHCIRAIRHACAFGKHGLPLIKGGDWNDSFNLVGIHGKGESVWLAMFLAYVLKKFSAVCAIMNDSTGRDSFLILADKLLASVDANAWDGDHYLRCFYDDGEPMGKSGAEQCEIDLLPQSWSVISGMPDKERRTAALKTAYNKLVDKKNGIIKLFTPPFTSEGKTAGYVNNYPEGIRENGGQYTHGAVWLADAFFRNGEPDRGYELLNILNPAKKNTDIYKTEPYYLAGDVYSSPGMEGRGGWSIYTGSAGWFYRTVYERMLGIRQIGGEIKINPRLPMGFRESRVKIITKDGTREFIL